MAPKSSRQILGGSGPVWPPPGGRRPTTATGTANMLDSILERVCGTVSGYGSCRFNYRNTHRPDPYQAVPKLSSPASAGALLGLCCNRRGTLGQGNVFEKLGPSSHSVSSTCDAVLILRLGFSVPPYLSLLLLWTFPRDVLFILTHKSTSSENTT